MVVRIRFTINTMDSVCRKQPGSNRPSSHLSIDDWVMGESFWGLRPRARLEGEGGRKEGKTERERVQAENLSAPNVVHPLNSPTPILISPHPVAIILHKCCPINFTMHSRRGNKIKHRDTVWRTLQTIGNNSMHSRFKKNLDHAAETS